MSNREIDFYVDTLVVQTILSNPGLSKKADASMTSALIEAVKHYVSNNINPNDKIGSVLNMLAPGAVSMAFSAMGLPWLGILLGLAMRVFHIDVKSILSTIHSAISEMLHSGQPLSSGQVDTVVADAVQQHAQPATETEAEQALDALSKQRTAAQLFRDARVVKLAMIEFDHDNLQMEKTASLLSNFNAKKAVTSSILSRVISWFFKIALASAGLMVAGDMVNKFLGRPNALDDTVQGGRPVGEQAPVPVHTATQTKFPVQSTYHEERRSGTWVENIPNNRSSIEGMLLIFAKQVYQGLDKLDSTIRSCSSFENLVDKISFYNHTSEGDQMVFIPKSFGSKKQLVDVFIDEVAEKAS